jgi:hypothetical protein
MKHIFSCCCSAVLAAATLVAAQAPAPKAPPKSPAATESATIAGKTISITYNSPGVKGRAGKIFSKDGLISHDPHYPVWRAGANAATTLHTDADLDIGGLAVPAGTYTLFADISDPDNWMLIVNKKTGEWGLAYDGTQDLGKVKFPTSTTPSLVENLKYTITDLGGGKGKITLAWENKSASVNFRVK